MDYEMEELLPLVSRLAEQYTSCESTSVTYEKAEQLMGAVLYCIRELTQSEDSVLSSAKKMTAQQAYEAGVLCVEQKAKKALALYHQVLPEFVWYENRCLYDTFVKGLPEFFKRYDVNYHPQDTILTLDYPLLRDLSQDTGVDKIYKFIQCIRLEQKFLHGFPEAYVARMLSESGAGRNGSGFGGKNSMDNLCEPVAAVVSAHILAGKPLSEGDLQKEDFLRIRRIFQQCSMDKIVRKLEEALKEVTEKLYGKDGGGGELQEYLAGAVPGILLRMKYFTEYNF